MNRLVNNYAGLVPLTSVFVIYM